MAGPVPPGGTKLGCSKCGAVIIVGGGGPPPLPGTPSSPSSQAPTQKLATLSLKTPAPSRTATFDPHQDLPAPREAIPRPEIPLPAPREAIPRPGLDLPAPREAIPRPGLDLPASREAVPKPSNLPAPREAVPRPGLDLPVSRAQVPRSGSSTMAGLGPELFDGELPGPGPAADGAGLDLDLSLPDLSRAGRPGGRRPAPASASQESPPLDLLDLDFGAAPSTGGRGQAAIPAEPPPANAGLGFELAIEGASQAQRPGGATIAPTAALPVIEVQVAGDDLPRLAPPKARNPAEGDEPAPVPKGKRRRVLAVAIGAGIALALGAVAFTVVLPRLNAGPGATSLLEPFAADLAKDVHTAYGRAAQALADAAAGRSDGEALRAQAAELALLGFLGHGGERSLKTNAERWLEGIADGPEAPASLPRARALLAIAKGKGGANPAGLDGSPDALLVAGLARLRAGQTVPARQAFEQATAGLPDRLLPRYLAARAAEAAGAPETAEIYQAVLAKNPGHVGARLGLARLTSAREAPGKRLEEARALTALPGASPGERAEALVLAGRAAQALGRSADALASFQQAVAADGQNVEANVALGETHLFEGRYPEALARFESIGAATLDHVGARFGMGGALIATARTSDGLLLVERAAKAAPNDARAPLFQGWALELATPADLDGAAKKYRDALAINPAFLPASLRLAALLQRTGKVSDALKVLKDAEDAGAAPALLQLAWGEALIVAKEPDRAEEVFRKALATDPKLAPARLGLAAALEARGDLEAAREELVRLRDEAPETTGVRERIARLQVKLGERDAAIGELETEVSTGRASPSVRVFLANLAIELGKLDVAEKHLLFVADEAPETPGALYSLGRLRELQGDLGRALTEYRRATGFDGSAELHLAYGKALVRAGKEDDGLAELQAASRLAAARLEHGRVLLKRGDLDRAVKDFEAAGTMEPGLAEAHLLAGNAYDKMGFAEKAAAAWRNAVRAQPGLSEALYNLGRLEMDRGRPSAALELLRKAAANVSPGPAWVAEVYFQLGYAEKEAGSKPNARAALKRYLELAPEDAPARPEVERVIERLH